MSDQARIEAILSQIPYAGRFGIAADAGQDGLVLSMPYSHDILGNPQLPALHGGAVGAFLEITAQATLRLACEGRKAPATIGVTVEYLRPCRTKTTFAQARIMRLGRRIANVHVEAWQDEARTPLALLQGRFLMPD